MNLAAKKRKVIGPRNYLSKKTIELKTDEELELFKEFMRRNNMQWYGAQPVDEPPQHLQPGGRYKYLHFYKTYTNAFWVKVQCWRDTENISFEEFWRDYGWCCTEINIDAWEMLMEV
jgi:hypothetical protein